MGISQNTVTPVVSIQDAKGRTFGRVRLPAAILKAGDEPQIICQRAVFLTGSSMLREAVEELHRLLFITGVTVTDNLVIHAVTDDSMVEACLLNLSATDRFHVVADIYAMMPEGDDLIASFCVTRTSRSEVAASIARRANISPQLRSTSVTKLIDAIWAPLAAGGPVPLVKFRVAHKASCKIT